MKLLDYILSKNKIRGFIENILDLFAPIKPTLHAQCHWIKKDKLTDKWKIQRY